MSRPPARALPIHDPAAAPRPDVARDVGVVVVAAGRGERTGSPELKQFRWVAGKPMLLHSVQTFLARPDVAMLVAVLPRDAVGDPPPWLFQCDIERLLLSVGGKERGDSVFNGLEELPPVDVIVVHDAARPLVDDATIDRVIAEARRGRGAVAALPVVDTLKETDAEGRILRTVPRAGLWRAQTPQAFPRAMLADAYLRSRRDRVQATDDAALCEHYGHEVVVVRGSERLIKITAEEDFARAEALASLGAETPERR